MSPYGVRDIILAHQKNKVFPSLPVVHLFLEGHLHLEDPGDPIERSQFNKKKTVFQVASEYTRYSSIKMEKGQLFSKQ